MKWLVCFVEQHYCNGDLDVLFFCRFDESGISPQTIKALSSAGYVHMTRVQEASLSICLEGMLPFCFRFDFRSWVVNPFSIFHLLLLL